MTTDAQRLSGYIEVWRSAVDDVVALLRQLSAEEWRTPTDLAGWDVRAVACHLAHLESELSGVAQERVEVPELEHLTAPSARYTEAGVIARHRLTDQEVVDELVEAVERRQTMLREDPPTDGSAMPPITPGGMPWNWEKTLRNRPFDIWMHEQDIRRAVGRPGGLNSAAAAHCVTMLATSFPVSVGKFVSPPAGTSVVLDVSGARPVHLALRMNDEGRAIVLDEDPAEPTVSLAMDTEAFVVLGGGRRPVDQVPVRVEGDEKLGRRILEALSVTP